VPKVHGEAKGHELIRGVTRFIGGHAEPASAGEDSVVFEG